MSETLPLTTNVPSSSDKKQKFYTSFSEAWNAPVKFSENTELWIGSLGIASTLAISPLIFGSVFAICLGHNKRCFNTGFCPELFKGKTICTIPGALYGSLGITVLAGWAIENSIRTVHELLFSSTRVINTGAYLSASYLQSCFFSKPQVNSPKTPPTATP